MSTHEEKIFGRLAEAVEAMCDWDSEMRMRKGNEHPEERLPAYAPNPTATGDAPAALWAAVLELGVKEWHRWADIAPSPAAVRTAAIAYGDARAIAAIEKIENSGLVFSADGAFVIIPTLTWKDALAELRGSGDRARGDG